MANHKNMIHRRYALLWFLLAAAIVSAAGKTMTPYDGARIFWDISTRKNIFNGGGYARLIPLQDGRLMACAEWNGIVVSYSKNQGKTWTSAQRIVTNSNNVPNCAPDLIQLRDGTLIVAYNPRPSQPYTTDRHFGIRCVRSTDNGATWSEEIFVNDASHLFEDGCWEPSMLELPDGELQLYFADEGPYTSSSEQQISVCTSTDGGLTWGKAKKASFRSKYRDGMPSPVLLNDGKSIVVAIEDNGWSGVNDFIPTTVRTTTSRKWSSPVGVSANRAKMIDYDYCPLAKGGAPYLCVLPEGTTVCSHQSNYGHGDRQQMYVYVGNQEARHFKAMSTPFILGADEAALWNSVACIDSSTIVAVAGLGGHVVMEKGTVTSCLHVPFSHPHLDASASASDGYYKASGTQLLLGTANRVRFYADFAYDADSLYLFARADDRTRYSGAEPDGMRVLLDIAGASSDQPTDGVFNLFFQADGNITFQKGCSNGCWESCDTTLRCVMRNTSTFYSLEAAIPWTTLGVQSAPIGRRMAATLELQDNRGEEVVTERMPDALTDASWTWMELRLDDMASAINAPQADKLTVAETVFDLQGRIEGLPCTGTHIIIRNGRKSIAR